MIRIITWIVVFMPFTRAESDFQWLDDTWKMAKDFNQEFKMKSWVIHYEDESLNLKLIEIMKEEMGTNYIELNNVKSGGNLTWLDYRPRTINLYIGEYFNEVQQLANLNQVDANGQTLTGVWLVQIAAPENGKEERDIQSIFQYSPMRFDSLVFAFYKPDGKKDIMVHDVYKINETSKNIDTVFYGNWSPSSGIDVDDFNIWNRRANLKGFKFRIASKYYPPEQTRADDGCTSSECFQGYYPNLIFVLQSFMNFTFEIKVNNVFGKKLPNGTWIGEIGLVHERKVDFAVDPFGWRKDRFQVVDYLPMNKPALGRLYIANPKETFDWYVYTKPLTVDSWCAVALFILFVPLLMVTMLIDWNDPANSDLTLTDCYVIVYKSLLMLGGVDRCNNMSRRISYLTILTAGMLLYWLWEALMISYFAYPSKSLPFNTLPEFLTKSDKKLLLKKGSMHEALFRESDDPIKLKIFADRIEPYLDDPFYKVKNNCEFFEKILLDDSYAAYIMSSGSIKRCPQFKKCEVIAIPDVIDISRGGGWTFQKNSPFLPMFDFYINLLKEHGTFQRIEDVGNNKTLGPDQDCQDYDGKPIGYKKVFSLLTLLMFGMGFSITLFILEVIVPKGWMIGVKGVWNNLTNGLMFAVIGAPRNSNSQEKHELERKENNF